MPRKKTLGAVADVLSSAENLRNAIGSLQAEIRDKARDLALAIVHQPIKRRGRPPKTLGRPKGRPRKRGRPRKPKAEAPS